MLLPLAAFLSLFLAPSQDIYTGPDCLSSHATLALKEIYTRDPPATSYGAYYDHVQVSVADALSHATGDSLSLVVEASFSSSEPLPDWVTEQPLLFVSGTPVPIPEESPLRVPLESSNSVSITLHASQVPSGTVYASLLNPLSAPYRIGC